MKLQSQVIGVGIAAAVMVALTGAAGVYNLERVHQSTASAILAFKAVDAARGADMMHDSIRGDAQLAALGKIGGKPELVEEARLALERHAGVLHEDLVALSAMPLPADAAQALTEVKLHAPAYIAAGKRLQVVDAADANGIERALQRVNASFVQLEDSMGRMNDRIAAWGETLVNGVSDGVRAGIWMSIAIVGVTAVLMIGLAILLGRLLAKPMAHAVNASMRLSEGDLTVEVDETGND
ncbi:MAG: hypothetical protein R3E87_27100, partial [Burkholderiaceae bacterium]